MTAPATTGRLVSLIFRLVVVCVLLAGASVIFYWLTSTRRVPPSTLQAAMDHSVEVIEVTPGPVARIWLGYGVAEAVDSADIPSSVSSTVLEVPDGIEIGRPVDAGALLVRLDSSDFEQQVEIALQTLAELKTRLEQLDLDRGVAVQQVEFRQQDVEILDNELDRVRAAFSDGAATQREIDLIRQRLIQARSAAVAAEELRDSIPLARRLLETQVSAQEFKLELARRNVQRCRITSPIDGVLESIDVEIGERVDPLRRVARVVDPLRIVVPIRLPSSARGSIRVGNGVVLKASGSIRRSWPGEIQRISPVDDGSTRTMAVFVELEPAVGLEAAPLAPGTFLAAEVTSSEARRRIVVPRSAVRNERIWYVDESGVIASRRVDVAFPLESSDGADRRLVLDSMLPEGALVVIDAGRSLPPGTTVHPVIRNEPTATASGELP
jgi:HlyD family secretion protein